MIDKRINQLESSIYNVEEQSQTHTRLLYYDLHWLDVHGIFHRLYISKRVVLSVTAEFLVFITVTNSRGLKTDH